MRSIEKEVDSLIYPHKKISRRGIGLSKKMAIGIFVLMIAAALIASGALLSYYGKVTTTATVTQSVLLDGKDYSDPLTNNFNAIGGCCKWSCHDLENKGCEDAPVSFDTSYSPDGVGITTKYYTPTHYYLDEAIDTVTQGDNDIIITVEDGECHITWTIDFPVEDYTGGGHMEVALIIAQDGDGNGPSFQIHNNGGVDPNYRFGRWLYSPWGPTSDDGWFGWHSGDINIPLEELSCQWASATGHKWKEGSDGEYPYNDPKPNPTGVFTITLAKCVLGADFHWALAATICSGFNGVPSTQYYYPTGFSWGTPTVTMTIPNYEPATILTDLGTGFTLGKYQSKEIIICHCFDMAIVPGTYTITSKFQPGP